MPRCSVTLVFIFGATCRRSERLDDKFVDIGANRFSNSTILATSVTNPAGCYIDGFPSGVSHTGASAFPDERIPGEFPREDFEWLISLNETGTRHGGPAECRNKNQHLKWCPEPEQSGPDEFADAELQSYIKEALRGIDSSRPVSVAVFEGQLDSTARGFLAANFVCGWERLQLLENRSAVVATTEQTAKELRATFPTLRVLHHSKFESLVNGTSKRTALQVKNRLYKMVVAKTFLDAGFDVVLSDLDVYWVRDPVDLLHQLGQTGVEFAAQKDFCWLEVNSGFLYYRATEATKNMLSVALSTYRDPTLCADNDQYLINCGFGRAAAKGLKYKILPPEDFQFVAGRKLGGVQQCTAAFAGAIELKPAWLGDGLPYIWHTSLFGKESSLDQLAALDLVDVDAAAHRCIAGPRGSADDARGIAERMRKVCSSASGAINHARCVGSCKPDNAEHAQKLLDLWNASHGSEATQSSMLLETSHILRGNGGRRFSRLASKLDP